MDNFADLLDFYAQSHRHPVNKILHIIGIPCVLFSVLLFFSWIHISMPGLFDIHTSWIFSAILVLYYFRLDAQFALLLGALLLPCIFLANILSGYWLSFPTFCVLFATGWILQLIGYFIEGEQPAFITKPYILLSLPLLVLSDVMCNRGYRQDLQLFRDN